MGKQSQPPRRPGTRASHAGSSDGPALRWAGFRPSRTRDCLAPAQWERTSHPPRSSSAVGPGRPRTSRRLSRGSTEASCTRFRRTVGPCPQYASAWRSLQTFPMVRTSPPGFSDLTAPIRSPQTPTAMLSTSCVQPEKCFGGLERIRKMGSVPFPVTLSSAENDTFSSASPSSTTVAFWKVKPTFTSFPSH